NTGDHAGAHGEACDYCVLAARLLPWLALLVLCLLQAAAGAGAGAQAGARNIDGALGRTRGTWAAAARVSLAPSRASAAL
ncbi:hypothetical protein XPN_2846, partial [Xanthomonas arboricola pv. pruni MAFF 301427]